MFVWRSSAGSSSLSRLQSLVHALGAAKASPAALSYRLDLWRAIHVAPRFDGGLLRWWGQRHIRLQGSPESLPALLLPTHAVAQAIHEDFRANFRLARSAPSGDPACKIFSDEGCHV